MSSGSSSFSCDLGPTVSDPTTISSSSKVSTIIDNNNDVEEEDSVVGSEIAGSSSLEREELSSSWSETPVDVEKVTPSQKVSRQRKRISDKFERMEGLMEKRLKYRKIAKKQLEKWNLRWRKGGRKRARTFK